jgi:hypothetical protein
VLCIDYRNRPYCTIFACQLAIGREIAIHMCCPGIA